MTAFLLHAAIRIVVLLGFVLAAGTVRVYRKHRVPIRLGLRAVRPDELPAAWHECTPDLCRQLYGLGFVRTGLLGGGTSNLELMTNPRIPVAANVCLIVKGERRHAYVSLTTRFDDGYVVDTINSRSPGIFIYPPHVEVHRSKATWVKELLDEHLASVRAAGAGRAPRPAPQVSTAETVIESNYEVTMHQVACGLLRETGDGRTLSYTPRGAMRSTFRVWKRFGFLRRQAPPPPRPAALPASRAA